MQLGLCSLAIACRSKIGGDCLVDEIVPNRRGDADRVESLDLLRGLAAFAVMIPHFFMYHVGDASPVAETFSVTAVEVFFVLSGFVLGPQIMLCAQRRNAATLRTFLVRRWMRTVPSFLVALLAMSVVYRAVGSSDFFRYMTYAQNLFAQYNERDYYPVAWSLSVEEWYYVVFPLFLLLYLALVDRRERWRDCLAATVLFIALISVVRIVHGDNADWGGRVRRVVAFRIDSIAYGFLLFLLLQRLRMEWDARARWLLLVLLASTTGLLVVVNTAMQADDAHWLRQINPFVSAAFGMSMLTFFLSIDSMFRKPWMKAGFTYLGRISYPTYLFHLVILFVLGRFLTTLGAPWSFFLYVGAVVAFTTLFFYGFEKVILASRPRYQKVGEELVLSRP
ncbi:MAG: hypothetical protein C5B56_11940 [Proteobacteria bacterium]|nr:MAG: hypothetical protein C5B56_11940 [Pseudomonadota bacterium]